jgi:hypothetical protein
MKGYLLKDLKIVIGKEAVVESVSPENKYEVIFEDDAETGYFYAAERIENTNELRILDMLLVYDVDGIMESERTATLNIIWSTDWLRCGLVLNNYCHAVIDFGNKAGYNRHGFPLPVLWTQAERKLTDKMVASFFE